MRYSWLFGLQNEAETAQTIWNLAQTKDNNILAALGDTSSDNEMLLFLVDRFSGAQVLSPHLIWHDAAATSLQTINPSRNQNMYWVSSSTLFVASGFEEGFSCYFDGDISTVKSERNFIAFLDIDVS